MYLQAEHERNNCFQWAAIGACLLGHTWKSEHLQLKFLTLWTYLQMGYKYILLSRKHLQI